MTFLYCEQASAIIFVDTSLSKVLHSCHFENNTKLPPTQDIGIEVEFLSLCNPEQSGFVNLFIFTNLG